MSGSFEISGGQIVITNGARTVATTGGTLVNLLPAAYDYSDTINVVFPDFDKDYWYHHWWASSYNVVDDEYALDEGAVTSVTAIPQEWSAATNLVAAPTGADFFAGMVKISRTGAPDTWGGATIDVLPKQGQWLPFTGSVLCEAEVGMARAFSIYISGGYLVLHRQQSVSVAAGGWGSYGDASPVLIGSGAGVSHTYGTTKGIQIHNLDTSDIATYYDSGDVPAPPKPVSCAPGGANAASTTDTTNYQSTYSVEIVGKFGRRS